MTKRQLVSDVTSQHFIPIRKKERKRNLEKSEEIGILDKILQNPASV